MARDDDEEEESTGIRLGASTLGEEAKIDPSKELDALLLDLVSLLKNPDVVGVLAERGVNASLALVALEGISAYLIGDKAQAAEDLRCVAEEIEGRLKFGDDPPSA
jgi:hypothetical protein